MKGKNILIVSLIFTSLIIPITSSTLIYANPQPANGEIEWGVKEGKTYTWIVKQSLENFGFLPKNSEFQMTITSITSLGGGNATELNATITVYNSVTELTSTLLDNATFAYFDSSTNTTVLYTQIDDHALLYPPDFLEGFMEGVWDYYGTYFNPKGSMTVSGIYTFYGYRSSTNLIYMWTFKANGICDNFIAIDYDVGDPNDPSTYDYWLVLKSGSSSIPFGNFFLLFLGLTIISLLGIHRRKFKYS